jgi:hypothetical protein
MTCGGTGTRVRRCTCRRPNRRQRQHAHSPCSQRLRCCNGRVCHRCRRRCLGGLAAGAGLLAGRGSERCGAAAGQGGCTALQAGGRQLLDLLLHSTCRHPATQRPLTSHPDTKVLHTQLAAAATCPLSWHGGSKHQQPARQLKGASCPPASPVVAAGSSRASGCCWKCSMWASCSACSSSAMLPPMSQKCCRSQHRDAIRQPPLQPRAAMWCNGAGSTDWCVTCPKLLLGRRVEVPPT